MSEVFAIRLLDALDNAGRHVRGHDGRQLTKSPREGGRAVMTNVALCFERVRTRGAHRDLRLRIGAYKHPCDSYYFGLDDSPVVPGGLGARLARLLEQWATQVEGLSRAGGTAYLPYDFSDQCTAWLRVTSHDGESAEVQAGWSLIEAWGIEPSNYLATAPEVTDFDPITGARITCSLDDLTAHIAANVITLEAAGP